MYKVLISIVFLMVSISAEAAFNLCKVAAMVGALAMTDSPKEVPLPTQSVREAQKTHQILDEEARRAIQQIVPVPNEFETPAEIRKRIERANKQVSTEITLAFWFAKTEILRMRN